jgi:hypothetical protein
VGRIAIRRPAQRLLGIADRLAGVGADNAIGIARIMPAAFSRFCNSMRSLRLSGRSSFGQLPAMKPQR